MPVIPFAEWMPDQPSSAAVGSGNIRNVIPRIDKSYAPMPTPQVLTQAVPERVLGAFSLVSKNRNTYTFAGTQHHIYHLGGNIWRDVTTPDAEIDSGVFTDGAMWDATAFGERVIFTNFFDRPQTFLVEADSTFSRLPSGAPRARYCATIGNFLMLGFTNDSIDGIRPRRLWWSAIGNPLSWPVPGSNTAVQLQSDFQDLEQSDLGHMRGLVGALSNADGAAFMERGIYRISYVGSPAIFDFSVAEGASGTQAPRSIVQRRMATDVGMKSVAYYLGEDGFYAFDGISASPIGANKWSRTVMLDIQQSQLRQTMGAADPANKLIFWAYVGSGGSDFYNRLLVYNWENGRATICDLAPAEWVGRGLTAGFTLDQLDQLGDLMTLDQLDSLGNLDSLTAPLDDMTGVYGTPATLETLPNSLDSNVYFGGSLLLMLFDDQHRLNNMVGPNLAPIVETVEASLPGRRTKLHGTARPVVEGRDGRRARIAVGRRETLWEPVVYDAEVPANVLGVCGLRSTGRYVRLRLRLPAASDFDHLVGIDTDTRAEGRLR